MNSDIAFSFIGLGAAKCGTTSLDAVLRYHPQVMLPTGKDQHYFDHDAVYARGLSWYRSLYEEPFREVAGEVSATYLYSQEAPHRIRSVYGDSPLFIVLLRNPIDRAYSEYLHYFREGRVTAPFAEYIHSDEVVFETGRPTQAPFIYRGYYSDYIGRYKVEFPKARFFITTLERFTICAREEFLALAVFLGISNDFPDRLVAKNAATASRLKLLEKLQRHPIIRKIGKAIFMNPALRKRIRAGVQGINRKSIKNATLDDLGQRRDLADIYRASVQRLRELSEARKLYWEEFE